MKGSFTLTDANLRSKKEHQNTGASQPKRTNPTEVSQSLGRVEEKKWNQLTEQGVDIHNVASPFPKPLSCQFLSSQTHLEGTGQGQSKAWNIRVKNKSRGRRAKRE